jgi:hypothetical protein
MHRLLSAPPHLLTEQQLVLLPTDISCGLQLHPQAEDQLENPPIAASLVTTVYAVWPVLAPSSADIQLGILGKCQALQMPPAALR